MIQTAITKMGTGIRITFTDGEKTERIYLSQPEFVSLVDRILLDGPELRKTLKVKDADKGATELGFA